MTTLESAPPPDAPAGSGATFRRWRGLEDIPGMAAANARLRGHIGLPEPIDVDGMLHRYTHLVNSDPARDCILVERDGAVRGYARVEWHDLADGDRVYDLTTVLEPSAWGLGITEAMIGWGEVRSREVALEHPTRAAFALLQLRLRRRHRAGHGPREPGLHGGPLGRRDAAAGHGGPAGGGRPRWLCASGARDRRAAGGPRDVRRRVQASTGASGRAPTTRSRSGSRIPASGATWWSSPSMGPSPCAVLSNMVETLLDGSVRGMLESLATHPDHRRRGLARAAMARSLELLRAEGATTAYLGVDTDNDNRALALYESCGFRRGLDQHLLPQADADAGSHR